MKITPNRMITACFCIVILAAVGTKIAGKLGDYFIQAQAEQAKIEAETKVREEKIALEKAQAEAKLKLTKATVLRIAEEYNAQKTGLGAYKRPGDGHTFDLKEKDSYGIAILLLYSRGAVVDSFKVRSAGPDQTYYTEDDITEERWSANGAGALDSAKSGAGDLFQGAKDKIFGGNKKD